VIVITDLDNTLADARWRDHLRGDWDHYQSLAGHDRPIRPMIELINRLHYAGARISCVTTRPEKWRQPTMTWLFRQDVQLHEVLMRPEGDKRKSPDMKLDLIGHLIAMGDQIVAFDDREDVAVAYRAAGIITMQVLT
jgi:phosphoglycolate phosphatase-like HAD superfamily hydrolase